LLVLLAPFLILFILASGFEDFKEICSKRKLSLVYSIKIIADKVKIRRKKEEEK